MTTYSEEILAEIGRLENRYDIELVSIEHHTKWVDRCERYKRAHTILDRTFNRVGRVSEQHIEALKAEKAELAAQRDQLVTACEHAINTIGMMNGGLVRDGAAYVTMVRGTLAQLRAAIAVAEGENDQTVQR